MMFFYWCSSFLPLPPLEQCWRYYALGAAVCPCLHPCDHDIYGLFCHCRALDDDSLNWFGCVIGNSAILGTQRSKGQVHSLDQMWWKGQRHTHQWLPVEFCVVLWLQRSCKIRFVYVFVVVASYYEVMTGITGIITAYSTWSKEYFGSYSEMNVWQSNRIMESTPLLGTQTATQGRCRLITVEPVMFLFSLYFAGSIPLVDQFVQSQLKSWYGYSPLMSNFTCGITHSDLHEDHIEAEASTWLIYMNVAALVQIFILFGTFINWVMGTIGTREASFCR